LLELADGLNVNAETLESNNLRAWSIWIPE
jgi:hypothetical protein